MRAPSGALSRCGDPPCYGAGERGGGIDRHGPEGKDTVHNRREPRRRQGHRRCGPPATGPTWSSPPSPTEPHPKLPGTIHSAAEEIEAAGGQALPVVTDIRDETSVETAVAKAVERFGGIDVPGQQRQRHQPRRHTGAAA
ncbi:MAG: hypothetical protein U5L11_12945 [Arhodomonas sp.]|nr:hypothetical protein [Arhodomonas sp.]